MGFYDFEFSALIVRHMAHTVVFLPEDIAVQLSFDQHRRQRVEGEISEIPFEGAWLPTADGAHYLMIPKRVLAEASLGPGSRVDVRFRVGNQDGVDVPDALQEALGGHEAAAKEWEKLTAGRKRSFAYRVACAKSASTIAKRVDEVMSMIIRGEFYTKGGKSARDKTAKSSGGQTGN